MQFHFATVLVFFAWAIAFVGGMLLLGSLVRPNNPEPIKLSTYECGEPPTGTMFKPCRVLTMSADLMTSATAAESFSLTAEGVLGGEAR